MDKPSVLVIQTAFLGDFILTLPLLQELSKSFNVHVVTRSGLASLTQKLNCITHHYEIKKGDTASYRHLVQQLKKINFEFIYTPHSSFRSAWLTWQLKAQHKVGYDNWWQRWAFSKVKKRNPKWPEPLRLLDLIMGADSFPQSFDQLNTVREGHMPPIPTQFDYSQVDGINSLRSAQKAKQAALFFGSQWGTKQWPIKNYIQLASLLRAQGYTIKWLGSLQEAGSLKLNLPEIFYSEIVAGQLTLDQVVIELSRSEFCISNDSGGGHLAALSGTQVFSIFGPTVLKFGYRPWTNRLYIFEDTELKCRPCHHHGPKVCPLQHHQCMNSILPQRVAKQVLA